MEGVAPALRPARYSTGTQAFTALFNHITVPEIEDRDWVVLTGEDVGHLVSYLTSSPR